MAPKHTETSDNAPTAWVQGKKKKEEKRTVSFGKGGKYALVKLVWVKTTDDLTPCEKTKKKSLLKRSFQKN